MQQLSTVISTDQQYSENHNLVQSAKAKKIEIPKDCNICLFELQTEQKKITQLACYHIYHVECCKRLSEVAIESEQSLTCPDCREPVKYSELKQYSNIEELKKHLPLECIKDNCDAFGTEDYINQNMKLCPYPLASFPHQSADNFLEKNANEIILWLKDQFARKNLSDIKVSYTSQYYLLENTEYYNKPAIIVKLSKKLHMTYYNFYSPVHINAGENSRECFNVLLYDVRPDLMIHHLNNTYPNMFNTNSDVYISTYDLRKDSIFFNVDGINKQISLKHVFNLESRSFNWDKLKELLGTDCYIKLFSKEKVKYILLDLGMDCVDGNTQSNDNSYNREGKVILCSATFRDVPALSTENSNNVTEENLNTPTGIVSFEDYMV